MKVYVVIQYDYDGYDVDSLYFSKEKAEQHMEKMNQYPHGRRWSVEEWMVIE